jgi:hypothetical protein
MTCLQIEGLTTAMKGFEEAARQALKDDDFPRHMRYGRLYHQAADRLAAETGTDPRPQV